MDPNATIVAAAAVYGLAESETDILSELSTDIVTGFARGNDIVTEYDAIVTIHGRSDAFYLLYNSIIVLYEDMYASEVRNAVVKSVKLSDPTGLTFQHAVAGGGNQEVPFMLVQNGEGPEIRQLPPPFYATFDSSGDAMGPAIAGTIGGAAAVCAFLGPGCFTGPGAALAGAGGVVGGAGVYYATRLAQQRDYNAAVWDWCQSFNPHNNNPEWQAYNRLDCARRNMGPRP